MIAGIGTDIVAVERFQRFVDTNNTALLQRLFTMRELSVCSARKEKATCLAGRFAAKEAFVKALGTGLRDGISWLDMEVINDHLGKPELHLSGKTEEIFLTRKLGTAFLSISHDGGHAIAMVVLEAG
ncbi:holo-[acyl-carrier-protein] synthase [Pelotalea chapellei]|uniref:Holo-[acyl-carrier-protein] synthase n=1 Tax=Pelotalea chapellei TaxID=44671 RepID=A0ABS5U488_9BACT|nr:holo-[acyl-carrier-protein] synthase [Pelotalea chapellei]MBT1070490.1 holo-[acyl-carrier-protein] synthase [Pelotalea chapellei]